MGTKEGRQNDICNEIRQSQLPPPPPFLIFVNTSLKFALYTTLQQTEMNWIAPHLSGQNCAVLHYSVVRCSLLNCFCSKISSICLYIARYSVTKCYSVLWGAPVLQVWSALVGRNLVQLPTKRVKPTKVMMFLFARLHWSSSKASIFLNFHSGQNHSVTTVALNWHIKMQLFDTLPTDWLLIRIAGSQFRIKEQLLLPLL